MDASSSRQSPGERRVAQDVENCIRQRPIISGVSEYSGMTVQHNRSHASHISADNRGAGSLSLNETHGSSLVVGGEHHHVAGKAYSRHVSPKANPRKPVAKPTCVG